MKKRKTEESKAEKKSPPTVDELARMVENRDRLGAEHAVASAAVNEALKSVLTGTYIAADGGIVRVYHDRDAYRYHMTGMDAPRYAEFFRPLREIK